MKHLKMFLMVLILTLSVFLYACEAKKSGEAIGAGGAKDTVAQGVTCSAAPGCSCSPPPGGKCFTGEDKEVGKWARCEDKDGKVTGVCRFKDDKCACEDKTGIT